MLLSIAATLHWCNICSFMIQLWHEHKYMRPLLTLFTYQYIRFYCRRRRRYRFYRRYRLNAMISPLLCIIILHYEHGTIYYMIVSCPWCKLIMAMLDCQPLEVTDGPIQSLLNSEYRHLWDGEIIITYVGTYILSMM